MILVQAVMTRPGNNPTIIFALYEEKNSRGAQDKKQFMLTTITKATIPEILPYPFKQYVELVTDQNLDLAFTNSIIDLWLFDFDKINALKKEAYEPGKWTAKEMLQHLGDTERILCGGLIRVVRGETGCQIDFDAAEMVVHGGANEKNIEKITEDLIHVRKATHSLYRSLAEVALQKEGICWIHPVSVATMGYIILGHQEHHLKIIREKYFPLLDKK